MKTSRYWSLWIVVIFVGGSLGLSSCREKPVSTTANDSNSVEDTSTKTEPDTGVNGGSSGTTDSSETDTADETDTVVDSTETGSADDTGKPVDCSEQTDAKDTGLSRSFRQSTCLYQEIGLGVSHGCGLLLDGKVVCWGEDTNGSVSTVPDGEYSAHLMHVGLELPILTS